MKNKLLLLLSLGFFSFVDAAFSAFVPVDIARQVATNLVRERSALHADNATFTVDNVIPFLHGKDTTFYVVKLQPAGFVLVAAEDNVYPLMAYSFENAFPLDDIPEHVDSWLQHYSAQISYHRAESTLPDDYTAQAWRDYSSFLGISLRSDFRDVAPLLISTWNQDAPYNGMCPTDPNGPGGRVYAGCVATAMAQVMYYYRHPQTGNGSSSYYHNTYGLQSANYGNTTYRWNEMLTHINTPNTSIAELLYHCGVAVKMMYSPNGSGAYSSDAAAAMRMYFRYSSSTQLVYKDDFTDQAWKNLMRTQLDAKQPMYYHGYGSGGHAFNLDGYQGDDHFHFNWGWGGSYNGYYFLSSMNPGGSNFSVGQGAIINSVPDATFTPGCNGQTILTHPYGSFDDGSGPLMAYQPNGFCSWLIAPQLNPEDSISSITLKFHRLNVESGVDKVHVYDGSTAAAPLIGTYSGNNLPPDITSSGNALLITFATNDSIEDDGFIASYTSTLPVFCQKEIGILTDTSGQVTDGSGSKNYASRSICHWIIQPEGATTATLNFTHFDTEPGHDFVDVFAYEPSTSQGTLLGRFSGSTLPPFLVSNTGAFFITFFTNAAVTASGWNAVYGRGTVGIDEVDAGSLVIFPVPARDMLRVRWPEPLGSKMKASIRDLHGRIILELEAPAGSAELSFDLHKLSPGIYFVEARAGHQMLQRKFVKQ